MMNVEKLIEAAEQDADDVENGCHARIYTANHILIVRGHYESLLSERTERIKELVEVIDSRNAYTERRVADERSKVIAEVREWAIKMAFIPSNNMHSSHLVVDDLIGKLNSMAGKVDVE